MVDKRSDLKAPGQQSLGDTNSVNQRSLIYLLLRPSLLLAHEIGSTGTGVRLDGIEYRDAGFGEWTGFYDWLRKAAGSVIGVRYHPSAETSFLLGLAQGLEYAEVDAAHEAVQLFFSDERAFADQLSRDQAFVMSQLLISHDGTMSYALRFDTTELAPAELASILRSSVRWGRVESA